MARAEADLTQAQLGAMAGLSAKTVSRIENEGHTPNLRNALKIAKALNRDLDDLFPVEESA